MQKLQKVLSKSFDEISNVLIYLKKLYRHMSVEEGDHLF